MKPFKPFKLFDFNLNDKDCAIINLSENNNALKNIDTTNHNAIHNFIFNKIQQEGKIAGIGGYLERRSIYQKSEVFRTSPEKFRNIHLGIDIWCEAETQIYVPFDGVIHSFKNNKNYGDYGPTIITEHQISNTKFYLLFGHLTTDSINTKFTHQTLKKGEKLAKVGHPEENVGWPPHLHFQIILDIGENEGDYPGVCSEHDLEFYHKNCPDPILFLQKLISNES